MIMRLNFSTKKAATKSLLGLETRVAVIGTDRDDQTEPPTVAETFETAPLSNPMPAPGTATLTRTASPRIKTYTTESMPKAMILARRELGEDAILIQSKKIDNPPDPGQQYEVTFGIIPGKDDAICTVPQVNPAQTLHTAQPVQPSCQLEEPGPKNRELAGQIDGLRRELQTIQSLILRSSLSNGVVPGSNQSLNSIYSVLVRNEMDPDLVADLQRAVDERVRMNADLSVIDSKTLLGDHLSSLIRTDQTLGGTEDCSRPVVLVGAPGAGKTTAMMKLAIEFGIKRGRNVEILSVHRGRPEANPRLEAMTGLLDIRYQPLGSLEKLQSAFAQPRPAGTLVLVDTTGYGNGSLEEDRDFVSIVDSDQSPEVHLVLPAAWHRAGLRRTIDRFEIFRPTRLLFTMVDQAAVFGPMIEEALRTGKALSFANGGPAGSGGVRAISLDWVLQQMWDVAEECIR